MKLLFSSFPETYTYHKYKERVTTLRSAQISHVGAMCDFVVTEDFLPIMPLCSDQVMTESKLYKLVKNGRFKL